MSSEKQASEDKISLTLQHETNTKKISELGGMCVATLVVPGQSREIVLFEDACKQIEAYARLRQLVERKEIDLLVYYRKSRLGRTIALCETVVAFCQTHGVAVYDVSAPPSTLNARKQRFSAGDSLSSAFTSWDAQNETTRLQQNSENGMKRRVELGRHPNTPPFGYCILYDQNGKKQVVVNESESFVVQWLFAQYLQGRGTPQLAQELNDRKVTRPGGQGDWVPLNVREIIQRVWRYAGYSEFNKRSKSENGREYIRAKAAWQAIIDDDTAHRVIAEMKQRSANRHLAHSDRLSGVVWCGQCNRPMWFQRRERQVTDSGGTSHNFFCPNRHIGGCVSERKVLDFARKTFLHLQVHGIDEMDNRSESLKGHYQNQIDILLDQFDKVQNNIYRIDDVFADGTMDKDRYQRQIKRHKEEIQEINTEISKLQDMIADDEHQGRHRLRIEETRCQGIQMLETNDVALANQWLREHIKVIYNNRILDFRFV